MEEKEHIEPSPGPGRHLLTPEMHESKPAKVEWFFENHFRFRGIIHIGANTGQELSWYIEHLYRPILAFEPHPAAFEKLNRVYSRFATCYRVALGEVNGPLKLYLPQDGNHERSSKYFPIETPGHDWTRVPMEDSITVPLYRFDTFVDQSNIDISPYDVAVIDVQGMELEVLKGFGLLLNQFPYLIVECSLSPVYDGEAPAKEIVDFLEERGYKQQTPIQEHDDIVFKRRGIWD